MNDKIRISVPDLDPEKRIEDAIIIIDIDK